MGRNEERGITVVMRKMVAERDAGEKKNFAKRNNPQKNKRSNYENEGHQ